MVIPLAFLLLLRIVFTLLDFFSRWIWELFFPSLWRIVLGFFFFGWGLHWICRLLLVGWSFFTILILSIHLEHGSLFHLLRSLISFLRDLKLLSYQSFTCLVRITPRYFILFVAIMKRVYFIISFSSCFLFV